MKLFVAILSTVLITNAVTAQTGEDFTKKLMPVPLNYTVYKADEPIVLDGKDKGGVQTKLPAKCTSPGTGS